MALFSDLMSFVLDIHSFIMLTMHKLLFHFFCLGKQEILVGADDVRDVGVYCRRTHICLLKKPGYLCQGHSFKK